MSEVLLKIENLRKHFPLKKPHPFAQERILRAVEGVSLDVFKGETLGLVGESGCGKSTLGRSIIQLYKPTSGKIVFEGKTIFEEGKCKHVDLVRQDMQMIFQDPYSSLNPRMTVESIVAEPLRTYKKLSGLELRKRVQELLEIVGMNPRYIRRYPHEFSGGQCQRIGIARALALNPKLIIADEPISALDVSIQAQILNLLKKLQKELGLTYIFIAHDLAAVKHISDRIAVMYLGKIVELSDAKTIIKQPKHPYTNALISAIPVPNPVVEKQRKHIVLQGDVPNPINPPSGCHFHTRCFNKKEQCAEKWPALESQGKDHLVSCFYPVA
ncbi:MAG: ATP-binding cassette domain-containing protein [Bdellovibrionales bacterium]|nr:ATP-binding cassette domain-containing protein [Bdellovibrionales bacterium]